MLAGIACGENYEIQSGNQNRVGGGNESPVGGLFPDILCEPIHPLPPQMLQPLRVEHFGGLCNSTSGTETLYVESARSRLKPPSSIVAPRRGLIPA